MVKAGVARLAVKRVALALAALCGVATSAHGAELAQCYGTVSNGKLEGAVKLPLAGPNFAAYSKLAAAAGRTYLHPTVASVVLSTYAALDLSLPRARFVYGETGFPEGGRFKPHKTHQNGTSVDFFVPVKNVHGTPTILPSSWSNKFGYEIEFDAKGRFLSYQIDFDAYAEHLVQLHRNALAQGAPITLVIVDPAYLPLLFATSRGAYLRKHLPFMRTKPWVRHDEHFHADFSVPCKPLT